MEVDRRLARKFSSLSITLIINDINTIHWNVVFYIEIYVIMCHQAVLHNFQSPILFSMCVRKHRYFLFHDKTQTYKFRR